MAWWILLAFMVFEERVYEISDDSGKQSIDELKDVLKQFSSLNPQLVYVLMSMVVSVFWFIFIPILVIRRIFN